MPTQRSLTGSTTRNSSSPEADRGESNPADKHHESAAQPSPLHRSAASGNAVRRHDRLALERTYREILNARDPNAINALYSEMGETIGLALKRRTEVLATAMRLADRDPESAAKWFDAAADDTRVAAAVSRIWATDRQLLSGEMQAMMALASVMRARSASDPRVQRKHLVDATNRTSMLWAMLRGQPSPIVALAIDVIGGLEAPSRGPTQAAMSRGVFGRGSVRLPDEVMSATEKVEQYLAGVISPSPPFARAQYSTHTTASAHRSVLDSSRSARGNPPAVRSPCTSPGPKSLGR